MEHTAVFTFLNMEIKERKNAKELKEDDRHYAIVRFLDPHNTPCEFFVFKKEVIEILCTHKFDAKTEVDVTYSVNYFNSKWSVRLEDVSPKSC